MRYTVNYSSNNSGGGWWLTDEDWYALEEAGWEVDWVKDNEYLYPDDDGRFLGALATSASIETDDVDAAIRDWESITGQSSMAAGCSCCGEPHYFSFEDSETGKTSHSMIESVGCERNWF